MNTQIKKRGNLYLSLVPRLEALALPSSQNKQRRAHADMKYHYTLPQKQHVDMYTSYPWTSTVAIFFDSTKFARFLTVKNIAHDKRLFQK